MKKIFMTFAVFSVSSFASAKDIHVSVKGMVCGFCAQGIEKKFKALPQVDGIQVSLEKKTVDVKTKGDQDISNEVIQQILTDSGYTVEEIKK